MTVVVLNSKPYDCFSLARMKFKPNNAKNLFLLTVLSWYYNLGNSFVCLCWGFTVQSTTRSCRAGQLIVVLFLGRLSLPKWFTSTKRGRPRQQLTTTVGV